MKEIKIDDVTLTKNQWDLLVDYTNIVNEHVFIRKRIQKSSDKNIRKRFTKLLIREEMLCEKARKLIETVPNLRILTVMKYKHQNAI